MCKVQNTAAPFQGHLGLDHTRRLVKSNPPNTHTVSLQTCKRSPPHAPRSGLLSVKTRSLGARSHRAGSRQRHSVVFTQRIFVKSWQKNEAEKTPVHPGKSLSPWTWTRVRERYAHGGMAQEGRRLLWPPPLRYGLVMENLIRSSMHLDYGRLRAPFWCVWGVGTRVHKPKLYHWTMLTHITRSSRSMWLHSHVHGGVVP